jgi:pilus assembly protein Flp/PilA
MEVMSKSLRAFAGEESGATAIEYALLSSLIALIIIAALSALGTQLGNEFNEVSSALK